MLELPTIRRVTVHAPRALEETLIGHFLSPGSRGDTGTDRCGKGRYAGLADPLSNLCHLCIEHPVQPILPDKIMQFLELDHLENQAVSACVENVEVSASSGY